MDQDANRNWLYAGVLFVGILIVGALVGYAVNNANMMNQSIIGKAKAESNLSTLVTAIEAADLTTALSDTNSAFTVFAPTNAAFASIQSTVDSLLMPTNKTQLIDVLNYHVVSSKVLSSNLTDGQIVKTLNGASLKVRIINNEVFVNNAKVTTANVEANNGVIHIIDSVLVPGEFENVVGTAVNTPSLSTLVAAVQAAELVDALSNSMANFTVFAPTNTAFSNIQSSVNTLLLPENKANLQNVLQYHVIANEAFSNELRNGDVLKTLNNQTLTVSIENGEVFIVGANSKAKVTMPDIKTSNGVVHVIDTVLLP